MAQRQLGVALWHYRDHTGRRRRVHYGEQFELPDNEVTRGERAGVFMPTTTIQQPPKPTAHQPKLTASKAAWVDYAETIGIDTTTADDMTKQELIAAVQTRLHTTSTDNDVADT